MSDPQTSNRGFYQPTRGSDSGTWDLPVNANEGALDSLFSNVATISLTSVNATLTTPPNSGASWSGPYQSQSALIKLTGAISANITITIPCAGFFIFWNACTSGSVMAGSTTGSNYIRVGSSSPGNYIGLPPGKKLHVFCDGTDCDFVNAPDPGTAYDLHGATALPSWMTACTVLPYLIKDGTIYNKSTYPALASYCQNAFGGSGTTFAVPDELARCRFGYDTVGTGRLTPAVSLNGQSMGSAGGDQNFQAHAHSTVVGDPGHHHNYSISNPIVGRQSLNAGQAGGANISYAVTTQGLGNSVNNNTTGITVQVAPSGAGGWGNVPPGIVSFLPLIKT